MQFQEAVFFSFSAARSMKDLLDYYIACIDILVGFVSFQVVKHTSLSQLWAL